MPSFQRDRRGLERTGPLFDVELSAHSEVASAVPHKVSVAALIDTGASHTAITRGLAEDFGIHEVGHTMIMTPDGRTMECRVFSLRLGFSGERPVAANVVEMPLEGQSLECLIGRDVLASAVFEYHGPDGRFAVEFVG